MRLAEILGLTREQLFLKERVIRLAAADTKDDEPRVIPVFQPLYEILSAIPHAVHTDYVFRYKGQPLKGIRNGFKKAWGMPRFHMAAIPPAGSRSMIFGTLLTRTLAKQGSQAN